MSSKFLALSFVSLAAIGCGSEPESHLYGISTHDLSGVLPEPDVLRVDHPALSADELTRKAEADAYIAARYARKGYRILETIEMYSGDVVDWIDSASMPVAFHEPPQRTPLPDEENGGPTELDDYPELVGPKGSTPMLRPSFDDYIFGRSEAGSPEEFLAQLPGGQPAGQNRLYGGYIRNGSNMGVGSHLHQFQDGGIEAGTFSLLEIVSLCSGANPATTQEFVGAVVSRGAAGYAGNVLKMNIEFDANGTSGGGGDNLGGWNEAQDGFEPYTGRTYYPGITLTGISTIGGAQWWSPLEIRLSSDAWWVWFNGDWLGFYPIELFDEIDAGACRSDWYGEVFDPTPTSWTNNNMGTGQFASQGYQQASFHKSPYYLNNSLSVVTMPTTVGGVNPVDNRCYTTGPVCTGAGGNCNAPSSWTKYFFLGGPGGDNNPGAPNNCD